MLKVKDIKLIKKGENRGFEIVFNDDKKIILHKRRTIVGLLLLIEYGISSEEDLIGTSERLKNIKEILKGKYDESWINDRYADANKPFSELWTEEGFSFIRAEGLKGNRKYVLDFNDHEKLFQKIEKVNRTQLTTKDKEKILIVQNYSCNICGSKLKETSKVDYKIFSKDRCKLEFDHRIPVEKGGNSSLHNYQALCHYCNKSKRQICYICELETCDSDCVLVSPERSTVISATKEDITDRMKK